MPPSPTRSAATLLAAALVVLGAGAVVAVTQPGDLGDDDTESAGAPETTSSLPEGTTTLPGATTMPGTITVPVTPAAPGATSAPTATTAPATTPAPSTTVPGSGLGTPGTSVADGATADTGIESLLGPGLALLGSAGALRAARRRITV